MKLLNFNQVELLKNLGISLRRGDRRLLNLIQCACEVLFLVALDPGGFRFQGMIHFSLGQEWMLVVIILLGELLYNRISYIAADACSSTESIPC